MNTFHEEAFEALERVFGERIRRRRLPEGESEAGTLATVLPMRAEEVVILADVAERYSISLVALGAETAPGLRVKEGSIVVRFDLMRGFKLPEPDELWVEVEPGVPWLELDDNLRTRGQGLVVYPTSAPRATIGGWLALDGLGVGSFEYGWLSENVLSADVVLPGGKRREVSGEDLRSFVGKEGGGGMVVGARLSTRRIEGDLPFGIAFESPEELTEAVTGTFRSGAQLWHLAFLNPRMALARSHGNRHLLFGAYVYERATPVNEALKDVPAVRRGRVLPPGEAYRIWTERFYPISPSHPTPQVERTFISTSEVAGALGVGRDRPVKIAIQGTVARSGEVLLLSFDPNEEG